MKTLISSLFLVVLFLSLTATYPTKSAPVGYHSIGEVEVLVNTSAHTYTCEDDEIDDHISSDDTYKVMSQQEAIGAGYHRNSLQLSAESGRTPLCPMPVNVPEGR